MNTDPLVSVIIPVYNPGKHLYKCLDSILNQTHRNLELILVDDGSTDGSGKVCDEYAQKDSRIKVVHQKNSGVSRARNVGLELATGDYLHFPDSDDYIEPDTYEYCLGIIKRENCDVVNFEHFVTYPDHEDAHSYKKDFYGPQDTYGALYKIAGGVQFICNKFFPRKLVSENTDKLTVRFREDIFRGEDTLFAAQMLERAGRVWFDSRPLYHYVQTENSACRGTFRTSQLSVLKVFDEFRPIYEKYPEIWKTYQIWFQHDLIGIYYSMWADLKEYPEQQKLFENRLRNNYRTIRDLPMLTGKERIKFKLFNMSPKLFCRIHKLAHGL